MDLEAVDDGDELIAMASRDVDQHPGQADTTPPRLVRGEIDGDNLTLYFSEPLDETSWGDGGYFRIDLQLLSNLGNPPNYGQCTRPWSYFNFSAKPENVIVKGNMVSLTKIGHGYGDKDRRAIVSREYNYSYYVRSTNPTAKVLRDLAGNAVSAPYLHSSGEYRDTEWIKLDNLTRLPYPRSATVDGDRVTLTFNAPMDGGSKPAASAFTVKVNGSAVSLAGAKPVTMFDNTFTLTLAAAVASSDTVTVSYAKPSFKPLQNVICEDAPSFTDLSVTNSTP